MADGDIDGMLRRKQLMQGMPTTLDLRPTGNRPLVHPADPKMLDYGLQKAVDYTMTPAMLAGGAASGGPELMALKNLLPSLFEGAFRPFTREDPNVQQDIMYPLFHGTTRSFDEFDPSRTGDLGMHFGTLEQAQNRALGWVDAGDVKDLAPTEVSPGSLVYGTTAYIKGANVRPVNVDIENPVRLPDMFSLGMNRRNLVGELLDSARYYREEGLSAEPGLEFSPENKQRMIDWSISGTGSEKDLWKIVEKQIKESGHDGVVYDNKFEGSGNSYIVFDPKQVTPRYTRTYDPQYLGRPRP